MRLLLRVFRLAPLVLLSPLVLIASVLALAMSDLAWVSFGRKRMRRDTLPSTYAATVVIPNWNGRDLLEKYLPSIDRGAGRQSRNEIIVVDNGSTDGSAEFRARDISRKSRVLALDRESGIRRRLECRLPRREERHRRAAEQRHARGRRTFLAPLLDGFTDEKVFAVSCQIFFTDPDKLREETGLTQGWWAGRRAARPPPDRRGDHRSVSLLLRRRRLVRVRPPEIPGAGRLRSAAGAVLPGRHRPRLHGVEARLEGALSAAEHRLSRASRHHRQEVYASADPGRAEEELPAVLLEEHSRMAAGWARTSSSPTPERVLSVLFGDAPAAPNLRGIWRAFLQLPRAMRSRWRARSPGADRRYRSVPPSAGRLFSRPLRSVRTAAGAAARAVRFALPDLPADPRRRRLHVPDAARAGAAGRRPRRWSCWIARTATEANAESGRVLRLRRVAGAASEGRPR